jgi:transcriptional regulator with XRE-family HTH domain
MSSFQLKRDCGVYTALLTPGLFLSLREASQRTGVSHIHIRDIEGGRSIPSFDMTVKMLESFKRRGSCKSLEKGPSVILSLSKNYGKANS